MRTLALALAVTIAAGGCDAIFGIHSTGLLGSDAHRDEPPPSDAVPIQITLLWQIPDIKGSGTPDEPAISPAPTMLAFGTVGSPATSGLLGSDGYDTGSGSNAGLVAVPYATAEALLTSGYRLDYDPGTGLTELQTKSNALRLFVPSLTRATAPQIPASSGYDLTPNGAAGQFHSLQFVTSGVYTSTAVTQFSASEVRFAFGSAMPILGALAAPQTIYGDWQLLLDWPTAPTNPTAIDGYAITSLDLTPGQLTVPGAQPAWETTVTTPAYTYDVTSNSLAGGGANRFQAAMSHLSVSPASFTVEYGLVPSTAIVPFVSSQGAPDRALLIPLYQDVQDMNPHGMFSVIDIKEVAQQPTALLGQAQVTRTSDGIVLTSTLQTLTTTVTENTPVPYAAPLATTEVFGGEHIDGTEDAADVPIPSAPSYTLTWAPEATEIPADDYIVRLYEISGTALEPLVTYQVTQPQVTVAGSQLASGHTYIFGITSRVGITGAQNGDYSTVTFPFSQATVFPTSFTMQ